MKAIYQRNPRTPHMLRFDAATEESMREILDTLCSRWHLTDKPSISLLLAGVIREFAESVKEDPSALKGLMNEIKTRGGAVGRRDQFKLDGQELGTASKFEELAKASTQKETQV